MKRAFWISGIVVTFVLIGAGAWLSAVGSNASGGVSGATEIPLSVSGSYATSGTSFSIVSKSASPIKVVRVVANDRVRVYGCDLSEAMNGKTDSATDELTAASGDFKATTLKEGEEMQVGFWPHHCGDHIVKLHVETDRGNMDYKFE